MSTLKFPDPKELLPMAFGFAIGLAIIGFFVVLALTLGLPTLVQHSAIPHQ
ncbi:MAG TPA: hypothetical protein VFZ65_02950 [Planctomycetota bacterium]|nr:hypothetical protein [Planctomycetota bacterium]